MIPIPRDGTAIDITINTHLPVEDRRHLNMVHQEMIKRARRRDISSDPFVDPVYVFALPLRGVRFANIRHIPAFTKKLDEYSRYKMIKLAQEYVVEGGSRVLPTKQEAVARLIKQGYRI